MTLQLVLGRLPIALLRLQVAGADLAPLQLVLGRLPSVLSRLQERAAHLAALQLAAQVQWVPGKMHASLAALAPWRSRQACTLGWFPADGSM